jgi:hypothetical protein
MVRLRMPTNPALDHACMKLATELQPDQQPGRWDDHVAVYEQAFEPLSTAFACRALALLGLRPGERVIDVGAGTGAAALMTAARGADVLAIDASPAMAGRIGRGDVEASQASVPLRVVPRTPDETLDQRYRRGPGLHPRRSYRRRRPPKPEAAMRTESRSSRGARAIGPEAKCCRPRRSRSRRRIGLARRARAHRQSHQRPRRRGRFDRDRAG